MKKLFLIFLIGLSMAAKGWADPQDYSSNRIVPGPREPLDIELWADRDNEATYREGEQITLYFRANRDCYFALYNIDTRGNLFLLYPQNPEDANFIEGGVTYQIPNPDDDFAYWVSGPAGVEFVQAVASVRPFDLPRNWPASYRGSRAPRGYGSSSIRVDNENIEEFIYETNSRIIPMKTYPEDCAEDLYTFYVEPVRRAYRPVYYDYGYGDFDFPYGSEIWIDGVFYGHAPLYNYHLYPGTHIVRVIQPGCPVYVRHIYVYPRSHFSVNFSWNFNFGYRNHRYYRVHYPYSYFCYVYPDFRTRYRHYDRDDYRYRVVFDRDLRYKSWASGGKEVRFKDSKKYTPLQQVFKRASEDDRRKAEHFRESNSRDDSKKFSPIYRDWGKSKARDDGSSSGKEPVRYNAPEKGKKGSSDDGNSSYERKEPPRYKKADEGKRGSGRRDDGEQPRYKPVEESKRESGRSGVSGQGETRTKSSDGGKREESRPATSSKKEPAPAVKQAPPRQKQDDGARSKSSDDGKQTRSKKGRDD